MNLSKTHPCNALGWLYVEREIAAPAMQQQLRMRDQQLLIDPHASGEPPEFAAWAIAQVARYADQPAIAQQIQQRRMELHRQQGELERRMANVVCELEAEAARIDDDLRVLDQLLEAGA